MFAGLLCFVLESKWVVNMSHTTKVLLTFERNQNVSLAFFQVPLYTILGVAVTFALLFSIIDLVNYCYGYFNVKVEKR